MSLFPPAISPVAIVALASLEEEPLFGMAPDVAARAGEASCSHEITPHAVDSVAVVALAMLEEHDSPVFLTYARPCRAHTISPVSVVALAALEEEPSSMMLPTAFLDEPEPTKSKAISEPHMDVHNLSSTQIHPIYAI